MALMGYREYSRHAGVTLRAVQKAIEAGHIKVQDGKKIDSDQADRDWRNSGEIQRSIVSITESERRPAPPAVVRNVGARSDGDLVDDEPAEGEGDATTREYRAHRADREKYSALKQKLEYEQLAGELIPVEDAKRIASTTFRGIRDSVLNVPARLKDQLAALDDPHACERLVESALAAALASIDIGKLLQEQDD